MKKRFLNYSVCSMLCLAMTLSGCGTMTQTQKGAAVGGGSGAAAGAGIGALIGKDGKGAAIGAAIGAVVGTAAGALIGKKMDKKAEELETALENAKVETVTDANNLQAIRVTFDSGILFATNSAELNNNSRAALKEFAAQMADLPDTDISVQGHTDNTGTREVNERLSLQRAKAVGSYLRSCGIAGKRLNEEGFAFDVPVADNATAEGRKQNRRVEVYISANEKMIEDATKEAE